jgi:hypothetical protein
MESDDKGSEPESVVVAKWDPKTYYLWAQNELIIV